MGLIIKYDILCYDFLWLYHFKQKASNIVLNRYYVVMFSTKFYSVDLLFFYDNNNKLSRTAPRASRIVPVIYSRTPRSMPRELITVQTDS